MNNNKIFPKRGSKVQKQIAQKKAVVIHTYPKSDIIRTKKNYKKKKFFKTAKKEKKQGKDKKRNVIVDSTYTLIVRDYDIERMI